jgi:hypothetical protein
VALLETLTDTFLGSSIGPAWAVQTSGNGGWGSVWIAGVTVSEGGGFLSILPPANTTGDGGIISTSTYDFTGSYAAVKVAAVAAGTTGTFSTDTYLYVGIDSTHAVLFVHENGTLYFEKYDAGSTQVATVAYSPTTHLWWKLRESGGTIYADTSADGVNWSNLGSTTVSWSVTAVKALLEAGAWETSSDAPSAAHYQNFNVAPDPYPLLYRVPTAYRIVRR